jgi:hypothetical protein
MDEAGTRVPTDPAPPHRARDRHRIGKPGGEPHVEGAAVNMLAVLGNAEGRAANIALVSSERKVDSTIALVWPAAVMTAARKSTTPISMLIISPE